MKTALDPRHLHRQKIIQDLFAWHASTLNKTGRISQIVDNLPAIDSAIHKYAPEWEIDKIYHIDLAILRLAVYELTIEKSQPPKVVIDEAIELAKEFGNETSPGFINGVLGNVIKND